jgi:hypothetical protein
MSHFRVSVCMVSFLALTGCGGFGSTNFPDASVNPAQTPLGAIQGSDYGGHAPLVGAHVYVVEPGTGGYGSVVKGLLTAVPGSTTENGSWTNSGLGSDEFVPATDADGNPFYGVQTDPTGAFSISGDYTCDVGSPVFLIGYGGSPTYPANTNTFAISKVVVTGLASPFTYTWTVTAPPENAYIGEAVSISGVTGVVYTPTGTGVVGAGATALSTTQFSTTSTTGLAGTYTPTGMTATFAPTFNPTAVNMAMLGVCPSTGSFATGASAIHYIYMNEVSAAVTAYTLAGFFNTTATAQAGADEFHVGSSGTTQAIQGTTNAALTAANLYDIEGSKITTTYAGEGHIANTTTAGGNGTVPQALIDTLGNILAACVDSNNTYRITSAPGVTPVTFTGTQSPACTTLMQYASDNGVYDTTTYNSSLVTGHQNLNTAQAAFSLARFPQGEGTGTTTAAGVQTVTALTPTLAGDFAAAVNSIPTGNVPFTPNLTSTGAGTPNSFAIPIAYTDAAMLTPYRDAVDSQGNVWVVGATASGTAQTYALKFNNLGVVQYTLTGVDGGASVAIDLNDNAWVASVTNSSVQEFSSTGTTLQASLKPTGIDAPYAIAIDGSNDVWVGNETGTDLIKMTNAGVLLTSYSNADFDEVEGMAIDSTGAVWVPNVGNTDVEKVPSADNAVTYHPTGSGLGESTRVVVDSSDNAWFEGGTNNNLVEISSTGTILSGGAGYKVAGGNGTNPEGLGVDGGGNLWIGFAGTSAATSALTRFNNSGVYTANLTFAGIASAPQDGTRGAEVDSSGNVWVVENQETPATLIEVVGVAVPVVTPTSLAVKNNTLGSKP